MSLLNVLSSTIDLRKTDERSDFELEKFHLSGRGYPFFL